MLRQRLHRRSPLRTSRAFVACGLVVGVLALATVAWLSHVGFLGVSNDDASRAIIAWDFARHPTLDPTRSSWLPVPTYVLGGALALTGDLLHTPRFVSLLAAVVAWFGAFGLARRFGASLAASIAGASLAWLFPWTLFSAWAIGVPEMLCVAFTVWGMERLTARSTRSTVAGALLLTFACGCRYEAWLVAAGASVAVLVDTRGARLPTALRLAPVALVPLGWLWINSAHRGSAVDFVRRSAVYYAAQSAPSTASYLVLVAASIGVLVVAAGVLACATNTPRMIPMSVVVLLVGLAVMQRAGDGPTHHRARTLLIAVWLLAPWCAARLTARPALGALLGLACAVQFIVGAQGVPHDVSPDALAAGRYLATRRTPYAIETSRLDFLWVEWASARPERAHPDRVFGDGAPSVDLAIARWEGAPRAAVTSRVLADALGSRGWTVEFATATWRVLAQPGATCSGGTDVSSRSKVSQSSM